MTGAFKWIATWIIFIALLAVFAQTTWGKGITYWALWLLVVLLLVTHADELTSIIDLNALNLNG